MHFSKITIHSNATLSILVHTWHYFSAYYHPYERKLKNELALHAPFVSKGLYYMTQLYFETNKQYTHIKREDNRFLKICKDAIDNKLTLSVQKWINELKKYLEPINLTIAPKYFSQIEKEFYRTVDLFYKYFKQWFFEPPHLGDILFVLTPGFSSDSSSAGAMEGVIYRIFRINILQQNIAEHKFKNFINDILDVFYHELLHKLIGENQTANATHGNFNEAFRQKFKEIAEKLNLPYTRNEEPLVYILTPRGFLSERLNLIEKVNTMELLNHINDEQIRKSAEILLKYLGNYNWQNPNMSILNYLNKKIKS